MRSVIKRALLYSFNDTTCMYMSDSPSYDLLNISNLYILLSIKSIDNL